MQRISHGLRLLMDLLHHEVLIATLFCCLGIHLDLHQLLLDGLLIKVEEFHPAAGELRDFQIADVVNLPGILQNGRNIRCQIAVLTGNAEDHGTVLPSCINGLRKIHEQHRQRIGAADPHHGPGQGLYGIFLCLLIIVVNKIHGDFRVRLRIELIAATSELFLQLLIVFDDAVVHGHHSTAHGHMGMGIVL